MHITVQYTKLRVKKHSVQIQLIMKKTALCTNKWNKHSHNTNGVKKMFDYISSTAAFHFIWSFTIINEAGIIKMSPSFNSECSPTQKLTSIMSTKHILYLNFALTISSLLINFWRDNLIIYCATDEWFLKKLNIYR